jgi:pimeloyl-ACP methyl ester carboxylesterase
MSLPYRYLAVNNTRLAVRRTSGKGGSAILWLGGFRSDITGNKVTALWQWAEKKKRAFCCFDYFAHGASEGAFEDFTISRALEDAFAVLADWGQKKLVLVGSSMGAWIAMRIVQVLKERGEGDKIAGLVLIAPAPDFTEQLVWEKLPPESQDKIMREGVYHHPTPYSDQPYIITRKLIEDGRQNLVLNQIFHSPCPIHILHGTNDEEVPWQYSVSLMNIVEGNITLTLIPEGDHRLSTPDNIAQIIRAVEAIA